MSSSSTFGHRTDQPHPEGYTLPSAQDDWSDPGQAPAARIADLASANIGSGTPTGVASSTAIAWAGYGLTALSCVTAFLDWLKPSLWMALLLLLLPLALMALLLQSPLSFEVNNRRYGKRARTVNFALAAPFGLLLLPNTYHAQVNPLWPLIPAAVTGLAMLATSWTLKGRQALASPNAFVVLVAVCGALYGYAATSLANIQFDASAGDLVPLQIMDQAKSCGRSCSYRLELPASGSRLQAGWVEVSSRLYDRTRVGDTVCLVNHPGALTLPWYTVGLCTESLSSSAQTAPWTAGLA